jgi:hypothetical protein
MAKPSPPKSADEQEIVAIAESKALKAKEKIIQIGTFILSGKITVNTVIDAAQSQTQKNKATFIAALEYASKSKPEIISDKVFLFSIASLEDDAPRIKWESAKVISNTAHLYQNQLKKAVVIY